MAARASEIRAYLLRYAAKHGIRVSEHVSEMDGKTSFFCHVQDPKEAHSATAISHEGFDNALVMAFLSFSNPSIDFLDSDMVSDSV